LLVNKHNVVYEKCKRDSNKGIGYKIACFYFALKGSKKVHFTSMLFYVVIA